MIRSGREKELVVYLWHVLLGKGLGLLGLRLQAVGSHLPFREKVIRNAAGPMNNI